MLALVLAGIVAQSPAAAPQRQPLRLSLGLDATELDLRDLLKPQVNAGPADPRLLSAAPTSGSVSLLSSGLTVGTGLVMMAGFTTHAVVNRSPYLSPLIAGNVVGFLLMNFGPNMGDLMNGDVRRFVVHGAMRILLLLAPIILGPLAGLGAVAATGCWVWWIVRDTVHSRDAPARWAQRQYPPRPNGF